MIPDSPEDKRTDPRYPWVLRVDYPGRQECLDATENLSEGGLFVRTEQAFEVGTQVRLSLSFPGLLNPIQLVGTIAWVRAPSLDQPGGVGIRAMGAQDRSRLSELVNLENGQEAGGIPPGGYRILIVEDAPHIMEMFGYALKRLAQRDLGGKIPFEVHFAQDGHQALQKLKEQPFHLVMTDLRMPVMDGFELVRRIREDPELQQMAVIAISGMDPEDAKNRALDVGVDIYLRKPVQFTHVAETVKRLLRLGA